MDTSNSTLGELSRSVHPEDRDLATKTIQVIDAIVAELKPILAYITVPRNARGGCRNLCSAMLRSKPRSFNQEYFINLLQGKEADLVLMRNGDLQLAEPCTNFGEHWHFTAVPRDHHPCADFPLEDVVRRLREVLADTKAKREAHLASIDSRMATLDAILDVLKK